MGGIVAVCLLILAKRFPVLLIVNVLIISCLLGWWRGSNFATEWARWQDLYGSPAVIYVTSSEDAVYGKRSQITFMATQVTTENGEVLRGNMPVSGFGAPAVMAGDRLEVSGTIRKGYGAYPASMSFAKLTVLAHHNNLIYEARRRFGAGLVSALPEPLGSFSLGLLTGQRSGLPDQVKQDLLMVGLTHIIAVSGYNLTIMLRASQGLFKQRSKRLSCLLSLCLIAVFLVITGAGASIVRAAIVSVISIATAYYGRQLSPFHILALAAVITALANPNYIWRDASWYLSFLAFYGVMVIGPALGHWLPERVREFVPLAVLLESLSAELMTLPYVLHTFGQMSLVGLIGNLLVVAFIPLAMLLGFAAGLAGTFLPMFAGWVAWPARMLLNYMLDTAHLLAGVPHIFREDIQFGWGDMLATYCAVVIASLLLYRLTNRPQYAKITDKK